MSKTHIGDLINAAKRVKNWFTAQTELTGVNPTGEELINRVAVTCKKFNAEDRETIVKTALVFWKNDQRLKAANV